jgi:hypothetical protein
MLTKVRGDLSVSVRGLSLTMVAQVVVEIWGEVSRDFGRFGGDPVQHHQPTKSEQRRVDFKPV